MGDLSPNFSRSEFACRDACGKDTVDADLLKVLQLCADDLGLEYTEGVKVIITGPNRCAAHNKRVGGSDKSQHLLCKAADIHVEVKQSGQWSIMSMPKLYVYFDNKYPDRLGLGIYSKWVHVDVREGKARW